MLITIDEGDQAMYFAEKVKKKCSASLVEQEMDAAFHSFQKNNSKSTHRHCALCKSAVALGSFSVLHKSQSGVQ